MFLRLIFGSIFIFVLGCASVGPSIDSPTEYSKKISASSDQDVCFSPDESCEERILKFIASSKKSIDIAAYEISLTTLSDSLTDLAKKIPIRIVVDKKESKVRGSLVSSLLAAGVSVRYGHQGGLMHDKFAIVDGKLVETGSFNYSEAAVKRNQENQIYLTNSDVVSRFNRRFQKMWDEALNP